MRTRVFETGQLRRSNWADVPFWKATHNLLTEALKRYQHGYTMGGVLIENFARLIREEVSLDIDQ